MLSLPRQVALELVQDSSPNLGLFTVTAWGRTSDLFCASAWSSLDAGHMPAS